MYIVQWRRVEDGQEELGDRDTFATLRETWRALKGEYSKAVVWAPHMEKPWARPYIIDVVRASQDWEGLLVWRSRRDFNRDSQDKNYPLAFAWLSWEENEE